MCIKKMNKTKQIKIDQERKVKGTKIDKERKNRSEKFITNLMKKSTQIKEKTKMNYQKKYYDQNIRIIHFWK